MPLSLMALAGLFASSFVSATILPGNSEVALVALLHQWPALWPWAWLLATIGNTMGGMTTWWLGRRAPTPKASKTVEWLDQHGAPVLLLSWVPLIGDGLCLAAGWLRLPFWASLLWMALGKAARYGALIVIARNLL